MIDTTQVFFFEKNRCQNGCYFKIQAAAPISLIKFCFEFILFCFYLFFYFGKYYSCKTICLIIFFCSKLCVSFLLVSSFLILSLFFRFLSKFCTYFFKICVKFKKGEFDLIASANDEDNIKINNKIDCSRVNSVNGIISFMPNQFERN